MLLMEADQLLCLYCAWLDGREFLPHGDTALTPPVSEWLILRPIRSTKFWATAVSRSKRPFSDGDVTSGFVHVAYQQLALARNDRDSRKVRGEPVELCKA